MKLKKLLLSAMSFASIVSYSQYNYGEALQKSIFFYEAQQSGELPDWNRVTWRDDSAMNDGSDVGENLTGGWYDAGDHVKFGFPMAYSATVLAWGAIEYKTAYTASGQMQHIKNNLRFVCDYFMKAHTAPNEFYGQLGGGGPDHAWWGSAEVMRMERPSFKIDAANPGSDLAGETAAALAAASMVFADSDTAYSATLLAHAKELYSFADTYRGKYSDAITDATAYYNSWSGYQDEIVWGAAWLYRATNDAAYLAKAESEYALLGNEGQSDVKAYKWGLAWDDKSYGCYILMALMTDNSAYKADAERHLDFWTDGSQGDRVAYSPGGQAHLTQWGSLRHTANTSFLAFVYSDNVATTKASTYHDFAVSQLNYILGDNPNNRSYMMGFGNNPPLNAHHRTAHGTWTNNLTGEPVNNRHTLYGALVGGPSSPNDAYVDDRGDFIANEVACDYNACFTGALARMYSEYGGNPLTNFPVAETPVDEFLSDAKFNSNNSSGVTVSVFARNHTAWPARTTTNLSYRYYFDISEGVEAGFSISDYQVTLPYSEGNGALSVKSAGGTIYYAEVSFLGEDIRPGGESESRREAQINIQVSSGMPWDNSNDFSAQGLTTTTRINSENIPIYDAGVLVFGNEPDGSMAETPTASFTASTLEGLAPLEVEFNASASSDPNGDDLTYAWDFGNGETSSLVNPTIIFDEVGSYLVSLTVSDGVNSSPLVTKTISVEDGNVAPVAVFTASPSAGIAPVTVNFDASSSSDANNDALTYTWDFGDGTTGTGITTNHEYLIVDNYTITLTVSDGSKTGTDTQTITVTDGSPVAAISVSETSGIAPFEITFNGSDSVDPTGEGLIYAWDFGNGDTATTASASVTYDNLGDFTVTLTVTNTAGDSDSDTTIITVTDGSQSCAFDTPLASALPTVNTEYRNIFVLGEGGPDLSNVTIFTVNWDAENNQLHQFSMNTSNGNPSWWNDLKENAQSFNSTQPEITFSGSDFAGLDGTYYATIDEGNFVLVSKTGGFTIYFSKTSTQPECGVVVGPMNTAPIANLTATPNSGTAPLSVTLDASGSTDVDGDNLNYTIEYGDGESGTGATTTHIYTAGEYTATVTANDGNGGTDTASVNITVDEEIIIVENIAPVAALIATPENGTSPLEVMFDASGSTDADGDNLTFNIVYGDGTSGTGVTSTHTYTTGEYTATVTVSDGNGGTDTASVNIIVDEEDVVVTPPTGDCTFGTPTSIALANVNTTYNNIYILGNGGPNMDAINKFTVNWDLANNGLYQFSFNLNSSPWYIDFSDTNQNFNEPSPAITLTGTGITGLDGAYNVALDGENFALVASNYTIYFSNSSTAPDCGDNVDVNEAPIAVLTSNTTSGIAPLNISFNGSSSTDPDGDALTYAWDFGDGTTAFGIAADKTFDVAGTYEVTLTVTDTEGLASSDTTTIIVTTLGVNVAPVAVISASTTSGLAPLSVSLDASGSTDADGDDLTYTWSFEDGTTATGVAASQIFEVGTSTVTLTVSDEEGLSDTKTINITATSDEDNSGAGSDNEYIDRFTEMRNEILDPSNGYFSADGSPHHSIETLIVEAPDYGHESTSELYSYWMWMEAMHGRISGDWQPLSDVWETTEKFIIPTNADQPTNAAYNPASPAAYAPEFALPSGYPAPLDFNAPVGVDPVSGDLTATYGPDVYQMHWLLDNDNFYGYGNRGDGVSTPSYINTFQRGEQESVYETVPHPSWESFSSGGESGFLPLFTLDANYSEQWRYTSATDADARAVQAMYWALEYTKEQEGSSAADLDLDKASKMGDYLRLGMFDKYFKPMGVQSATSGAGSGYDSAHYLMSWYISWGGAADTSSPWAFRISSSHCHFGYQNPVAAYALTQVDEMKPISQNGERDWNVSLQRQMEFYTWLQSSEGGIAGGATNSWNGDYSPYPAGVSTFYDMAYDTDPVYHDPGSGTWFGWQAWSMERVAEYYYISNDPMAKDLMDNWTTWVESEVQLVGDNDFLMPATLEWSGQPDVWDPANPGSNSGLSVTVTNYNVDLGIAASTAKALIYYAAATEKHATLDEGAKNLAKEILDRMWTTYRDDKGCSSPESRGDYNRIFEEEVYIPSGFTGVMGRGETIEEGVTFLDLRSGYLLDPEYPALLAAYESGTDYTTNYHRTWAQMEIALANAEYGFFFGDDNTAAKSALPSNFNVNTYPNPTSDIFTISVTALNGTVTGKDIVVTNLIGQVVGTKTITEGETSTTIDVSTYPSGMYLVTVYQGSDKIKVDRLIVN